MREGNGRWITSDRHPRCKLPYGDSLLADTKCRDLWCNAPPDEMWWVRVERA